MGLEMDLWCVCLGMVIFGVRDGMGWIGCFGVMENELEHGVWGGRGLGNT